MSGESPAISVVIPAVNGIGPLRTCLRSLEAQTRAAELEVVVVSRLTRRADESLASEFPGVKVVGGGGLTIPQMRAKGLEHARAPIVAVLADYSTVSPAWAHAHLRGHAAQAEAVGGSLTNGREGVLDWAAFFIEYSEHMAPLAAGRVASLPGNNVSYNRSAIAAGGGLFASGLWDSFFHEALSREGFRFRCEPDAQAVHTRPFPFRRFASQRWHFSRSFAGMRARGFPLARRLAYAWASFLLPPLLALRIVRRVVARPGRGYWTAFVRSFPLIMVFLFIWTAGEIVGYLFGPGHSTERVC